MVTESMLKTPEAIDVISAPYLVTGGESESMRRP